MYRFMFLLAVGLTCGMPAEKTAQLVALINTDREHITVNVNLTEFSPWPARFQSPGHPQPYGEYLLIDYLISAPAGSRIRFDVEPYGLRAGDNLAFSEAIPGQGFVDIGRLNSANAIRTLRSTTNYALATFRTGAKQNYSPGGFRILATTYN